MRRKVVVLTAIRVLCIRDIQYIRYSLCSLVCLLICCRTQLTVLNTPLLPDSQKPDLPLFVVSHEWLYSSTIPSYAMTVYSHYVRAIIGGCESDTACRHAYRPVALYKAAFSFHDSNGELRHYRHGEPGRKILLRWSTWQYVLRIHVACDIRPHQPVPLFKHRTADRQLDTKGFYAVCIAAMRDNTAFCERKQVDYLSPGYYGTR